MVMDMAVFVLIVLAVYPVVVGDAAECHRLLHDHEGEEGEYENH